VFAWRFVDAPINGFAIKVPRISLDFSVPYRIETRTFFGRR
jgi:hypothetical protein